MKKFRLHIGAIALLLAMVFVGCSNGSDSNDTSEWDGVVDMTKLEGYDADLGGVAKMFNPAASGYETVASFKLSDLGYTADSGFTKVAITAEVFNGAKQYDLASEWGARLMITVGDATVDANKNFNAGVANQTAPVSSADDTLLIQIKEEPVTGAVVTGIIFSK